MAVRAALPTNLAGLERHLGRRTARGRCAPSGESYSLPVHTVPGLAGLLWLVTFGVIQVVTNVYYHWAGLYRILGARWLAGARRR